MNRAVPIGILFLIFLYLGANVSSTWLWVISGIAIFLLLGLMFIMFQQGQFVGPRTLVDDVRSIKDRFVSDDGEDINDTDFVEVAVRRRRPADDVD